MSKNIDVKKITEQLYEKNLELLEQRRRTEELLYNVSEIIVAIDEDYKITLFNKTTQTILGIKDNKEILRKDISEVIKLKKGDKYLDIKKYCFMGENKGRKIKDLILETKDKEKVIYVNLSTYTVKYQTSKKEECLITITDITEEKMLGKMKDDFLSLAAHELRTPITIMKGYLWMLQKDKAGKLTKKQRYYIETILEGTEKMHNLINDMLNISRIEQGRAQFKIEKIDICKELEIAIEGLQINAKDKGIGLKLDKTTKCDFTAFADKTKLNEVFLNLVGNAIKFTKKGGVVIKILDENKHIRVEVIDTGMGVVKKDQQRLFKKFGRIDSSYQTVAEIQGTGLGLYITKQYIENMGGNIGMKSDGVGKGSTFWFTVPKYSIKKRQRKVPSHGQ